MKFVFLSARAGRGWPGAVIFISLSSGWSPAAHPCTLVMTFYCSGQSGGLKQVGEEYGRRHSPGRWFLATSQARDLEVGRGTHSPIEPKVNVIVRNWRRSAVKRHLIPSVQ